VRRREDNSEAQVELIDDLRQHSSDLAALIIVGDLVYTGQSKRDWAHLDSLVAPFARSMPILPAIGNHDYPCYLVQFCRKSKISRGMLERFPWLEPGRGYAVANGDLLFAFLDSESGLDSQGLWLEQELDRAAASGFVAALVFFHRAAFTNSIDWGSDPNPEILGNIVPRLEQAPLPVVAISGHIHGFEYIVRNGVHYLTTGGGGGPRGPMADERPFDFYRGPDCPQAKGEVYRPLNYMLLEREPGRLIFDVRGFCAADEVVGQLDSIEIPLAAP